MTRPALASAIAALAVFSLEPALGSSPAPARQDADIMPTKVASTSPPLRWEDAMISGNGSTGIMVMGLPCEELIIVNHEKLWTVGNDFRPRTPDLREAWKEARKIALEGRYLDADQHIAEAVMTMQKK